MSDQGQLKGKCDICELPYDTEYLDGEKAKIVWAGDDMRVHKLCREDHIEYSTGVLFDE